MQVLSRDSERASKLLWAAGDSWRSRIASMQEEEVGRWFCFWPFRAPLWGAGHTHSYAASPGKNSMGEGPQLEPDAHERTAFHVPKQPLQSGLLGRRALQSSSAVDTLPTWNLSAASSTSSGMCAAGGEEGRVLISSLRSVLWSLSCSCTAISSEDGFKR